MFLGVFILLGLFPAIRGQSEAELLKKCNGISFEQKFNPYLGIGQFYQLATYSNEKNLNIDYDCPREFWEIARNGTIYFNRQITRIDKYGNDILEFQSLDLAIPMKTSRHSSDYIWKTEGIDSPIFGRFSYRYVTWDNRSYCFVFGCEVTNKLYLFILSQEQVEIPRLHRQRISNMYKLSNSHHFPYTNCASVRPGVCKGASP